MAQGEIMNDTKPNGKPFQIRFTPDEKKKQLIIIAAENEVSVNKIVNALTDKFVNDLKFANQILKNIK